MKKITLAIALAGSLISTQQVNAQGFLKKLAAAMAPKPINGVWELARGGDGKFAIAQPQTQFKQFEHAKENTDKKLQIEYDGIVCDAARFIATDIPKIYTDRENQPNWWLFQTKDSTFFMVSRMDNYNFKASENLIGVITSNKDLLKDIAGWDRKNEPTSELLKNQLKEVQNLCDKIIKAGEDAEAESKKKAAEDLANRKLPVPTKTTPCNQAKLQELCQTRIGNDKIIYCYFGVPDMLKQVSPTNDWKMIKEKKTVNGTYDDFITKRRIFAICIYESPANDDKTTYNYTCITIEEEHAFDVWDGSKFNGELKATGTMYLGRITKANALQFKDVLK